MSDRSTTIAGSITGAYDETGRILYALGPDGVTRWSAETGAFLDPIPLAGRLSGIAVSPDGRYLVVGIADVATVNGVRMAQLHRIDLETQATDVVSVALNDGYEGGVANVAISAGGAVLFTTDFLGSGWTPLRSFNIQEATPVASLVPGIPMGGSMVRGASSLIASPDGNRILLLENGISNAPTGVYDSAEARIVAHAAADHRGYSNDGRGDISNDGLIAIITYGTMTIHDASMALIIDLGWNEVGRYTDAQFSHDGRHLFLFNQDTDRIELYDTTSWRLIGEADPGVDVRRIGNGDPVGDLELIDNGRLMLLTTASGVRVVDLVSRLTSDVTGTDESDTLFGTVGRDTLIGLEGDDTLSGGEGGDLLFGGTGDDTITGGLGNDFIDGGDGHDVLIVSGAFSDYRLLMNGDDFILKGPDGRDHLTSIETIRFGDGRVLELNRMYGPGVDSGAWADGRIPEALLSEGSKAGDQPLVLPGVEDDGMWSGKGQVGPQVLPVLSDDERLVLPGLEGFKAGGDEPLILPDVDDAAPLFPNLEARLALTGGWMLALDEPGALAGEPVNPRHDEWM